MAIYEFEGKKPCISPTAYIYPEATIIGDVTICEGCYIGPGARIRGDWGSVFIGSGSNIQENCVIHSAPDITTFLAKRSHIGHGSILHGPVLEEHVVIGMGAIIMDDVKIGANSCVAAGALVTAGTLVPPKSLYVGVPAKNAGEISEKMFHYLGYATDLYMALPARCFNGVRQLSLEEVLNKKESK